jgi:uncharacterized repeat protein (TIGR01451 family)
VTRTPTTGFDIEIDLTESADPIERGQRLVYTIVVTNRGSAPVITAAADLLPSGVDLVAVVSSRGGCIDRVVNRDKIVDQTAVLCSIGELTSGASATIQITVIPRVAGQIINRVAAGPINDPNLDNNVKIVTTTVL